MRLKLLGTAAGGAFPQWNCHCRFCHAARSGDPQVQARSQSSVALEGAGGRWLLINASPDVRYQMEAHLTPKSSAQTRYSPLSGVVLTDSQIDHASGLLLLREGPGSLIIYCTDQVHTDLTESYPVLKMLGAYCGVDRRPLDLEGDGASLPGHAGLRLIAVPLKGKAPPYSPRRDAETPGTNIALVFLDLNTGQSLVYAPALAEIPPALAAYMSKASCILADGTCWHDDDLGRAGCGSRLAHGMGHWPLAGEDGLLAALGRFPQARRVLVHINNTNPILKADSQERRQLTALGLEVGTDGMEITL